MHMDNSSQQKKVIVFSGGGTGGSVSPLLAVAEELRRQPGGERYEFIFVGTFKGPEEAMVAAFNREVGPMTFQPITSGKLRRYFSPQNIIDVFKVFGGWLRSWQLLRRLKPDLVVTAGAFVSVPLVWAAAWRRIPILVHQQDIRAGLANRLMAPFARAVTVTFDKSLDDYGRKAILIGNPMRPAPQNYQELVAAARQKYAPDSSRPLVFVAGGGTGSAEINRLVSAAAPELVRICKIIHITGKGKLPAGYVPASDYQALEFIDNQEVLAIMENATVVVSRCGLAFLTELSHLGKASILIPIPDSHQEDNARHYAAHRAAAVLDQKSLTPSGLVDAVARLLRDADLRHDLEKNIARIIKRGAAGAMAAVIEEIVGHQKR